MRCTKLLLAATLAFTPLVHAQNGPPKLPAADLGKPIAPSKALNDMLDLFELEFTGAAKTMPADKYSFAPAAATFAATQKTDYPKDIRTFAQQVAHVTQANYYFYATVLGTRPPAEVAGIGKLTDKDALLKALADSFAYGHKAIATITAENAYLGIPGVDGMHTRTTVADFAVAHGYDHYGQMVEYLRMNGLKPPAM